MEITASSVRAAPTLLRTIQVVGPPAMAIMEIIMMMGESEGPSAVSVALRRHARRFFWLMPSRPASRQEVRRKSPAWIRDIKTMTEETSQISVPLMNC